MLYDDNNHMRSEKTGKVLESIVEHLWDGDVIPYKKWDKISNGLIKNVPYTNIYGSTSRTEFMIVAGNKKIRIECKWQQSSGSVDEKFPYMFECLLNVEEDVIILLDGNGYRKSARDWLIHKCMGITRKSMRVMNISEFIAWMNSNDKTIS